ncbi:cell division protein FtsQ/DivIB [Paludisphaera rhizosphaerae]|uniref:hypothetical protein n=1 Tax=Paludisphaera rhizosphaerae TaxID=2711216 RepID=UPI0013EC7FB5|nr:hypothetical protein [Paludisphaera rhizosphaerae]
MEYRNRTRIVAPDGDDDGEDFPPPPRRFELARAASRLDLRKVAAASGIVVALLVVLFYAGGHALQSAVAWLHRQPQYQLPFDRIELPVPPPECFRGGAAGFLERVRKNAREPEVLPVLDVDAESLAGAFKQFPWVERVESVEFPPHSLVVRLAYRKPVVRVQAAGAVQQVLDREGCILPMEDIDTEKIGRLIAVSGRSLVAPAADRVGLIWKTADPDVDRMVIQAARLAGFLLDPSRESEAKTDPSLRITAILPDNPPNNRGLFVQTATRALILWGHGPGDEKSGEPSADEKWGMLAKQAKEGEVKLERPGDYWSFNRTGMIYTRVAPP